MQRVVQGGLGASPRRGSRPCHGKSAKLPLERVDMTLGLTFAESRLTSRSIEQIGNARHISVISCRGVDTWTATALGTLEALDGTVTASVQ